ncbi:hypothetical protein [Paenibacillus sp. PAMC 26794]|uniref:hypothetical protein n=1 Tax=Paenibacillus sp. PAMC 26794 TaxID=1257080 RepID=UPI0002FE77F4|nr:hypothetical protein [Paenibacillus sp. PAMC 26794]
MKGIKTIHINDLRAGQYINLNGEVTSLEKVKVLIASGETPVIYTVSDQYIERALDSLSTTRKEGLEYRDFQEDDPEALRILY